MTIEDQIVDAWRINDRLNRYLLDAVPPESLNAKPGHGRCVADQLAHVHNVRLMWLKASAPELLEGLSKLEKGASAEEIKEALAASGEAIAALLAQGLASGRIKNFKPHPAGFLGYLIAHEANHRGQAELILRQLGTPLDDKTSYGLWEWGVR